jgi:hypothetical protein
MWIANQGVVSGGSTGHLDMGVAPLPVEGQPATFYYSLGYAISRQTAYPLQAWQWLVFATRQPGMSQYMPARRSLANRALFSGYPPELQSELRQAYRQTLETYVEAADVVFGQATPAWSDVLNRLYTQAVRESWETGIDPQETLSAAQVIAEAYLLCLETHRGPDSAESREACEAEVEVPAWQEIYHFPDQP